MASKSEGETLFLVLCIFAFLAVVVGLLIWKNRSLFGLGGKRYNWYSIAIELTICNLLCVTCCCFLDSFMMMNTFTPPPGRQAYIEARQKLDPSKPEEMNELRKLLMGRALQTIPIIRNLQNESSSVDRLYRKGMLTDDLHALVCFCGYRHWTVMTQIRITVSIPSSWKSIRISWTRKSLKFNMKRMSWILAGTSTSGLRPCNIIRWWSGGVLPHARTNNNDFLHLVLLDAGKEEWGTSRCCRGVCWTKKNGELRFSDCRGLNSTICLRYSWKRRKGKRRQQKQQWRLRQQWKWSRKRRSNGLTDWPRSW